METSSNHNEYLEGSSHDSHRNDTAIFGADFMVHSMLDPKSFLSKYHAAVVHEPTCNEQCLTCCGDICQTCSPLCGFLGCANCCCLYMLPTATAGLTETFGNFRRLLKPGLNLINPCSEEVRLVDLRLKGMNAGRHPTITKDQVKVDIEASLTFRVVNPIITQYILGNNLNRALIELTVASLRDTVGQYNLDQLLIERFLVSSRARELVLRGMPPGIEVQNVFIDEIIIPPQIERDLTSAARQKRLSEATIINSKADVESATLLQQSAKLLDTKAAMQIRYLEMVQKLGQSGVLILMDIGADKKGHS